MPTETIIWTALPHGLIDGGRRGRLAVHVGPRLVPDTATSTLAAAPFDDFTDWPATLGGVRFEVVLGGGAPIPATVITAPAARSDYWQALFGNGGTVPSAPVLGRTFEDFTLKKLHSYPVKHIQGFLNSTWVEAARSFIDGYPDRSWLRSRFEPIAFDRDRLQGIAADIEGTYGPGYTFIPFNAAPNPAWDFFQLKDFHTPPAKRLEGPAQAPKPPDLDFHQMLGIVGEYPHVMRLLGLVVGLVFDMPPAFPPGPTTVRVLATFTSALPGTVNISPVTRCLVATGPTGFDARPRTLDPELADGYLRLDNDDKFEAVLVDPDGGAIKAMDFANTLNRADNHRTLDTPENYALPSLRAAGISVARNGKTEEIHTNKFVAQQTFDANKLTGAIPGANVPLWAEDVTRGYRVDVLDTLTNEWHCLSRRNGDFTFTATGQVENVTGDEAITSTAATSAHDQSSEDLYLQESLFRWSGWTLGAPRPGSALTNDDTMADTGTDTDPSSFPFTAFFKVEPGSLPRLRFGEGYRVRARAVDLAGNSLPLSHPSTAHMVPTTARPLVYSRFEPIQTPTLLLRTPRIEGDSLERIVLRSNYVGAPDEDPSPSTSERHCAASKSSQVLAEQHGLFDTPTPSSVVDASAYGLITSRESARFEDLGSAQPDPADPGSFYFDVDSVPTPYLPDVLCRGALVRDLAGGFPDLFRAFDGPGWPDYETFRFVLRAPSGAESDGWKIEADGSVSVVLDKANKVRAKLSGFLRAGDENALGIVQWLEEAGIPAAELNNLKLQIVRGRHWITTPWRVVTFVHAVRQPLVTPEYLSFSPSRAPGDTFAFFRGQLNFSRKSSVRLDLNGEWTEFVDAGPGGPPPSQPDPLNPGQFLNTLPAVQRGALTGDVNEAGNDGLFDLSEWLGAFGPQSCRHEFGDTRHRNVTYSATAFSRFSEFFRVRDPAFVLNGTSPTSLPTPVVPGSVRLRGQVTGSTGLVAKNFVEGPLDDFVVDAAAGEISRTPSSTIPDGDPILATWIPEPNSRGSTTPVQANILSTARPEPPKVLYIVPTFSWGTTGGGPSITRQRKGGLRVYMERPWWTSGERERLGVVCWKGNTGQSQLDDRLRRHATEWGVDPVHLSPATPDEVTPSAFPLRVDTGLNVTLPEVAGEFFDVAAHDVAFDAERDLWYCDLEISMGGNYFPFVRLVLVRYQKDSLSALKLSPVVRADYIQTSPDRSLSVVALPPTGPRRQFSVTVSGTSFATTFADQQASRVYTSLEKRHPTVENELGWVAVQGQGNLSRGEFFGVTFWTGTAALPAGANPDDYRLVVEEVERIRQDDVAIGPSNDYGERVVFSDVVLLGDLV
jgi:hypothetical protein